MIKHPAEHTGMLAVNGLFNIPDASQNSQFQSTFSQCMQRSEVVRISDGLSIEAPDSALIVTATFAACLIYKMP